MRIRILKGKQKLWENEKGDGKARKKKEENRRKRCELETKGARRKTKEQRKMSLKEKMSNGLQKKRARTREEGKNGGN